MNIKTASLILLALILIPGKSSAQQLDAVNNVVARARTLVESGNGRMGRIVLDSAVKESATGSIELGELLYWRGLLSEAGIDAERDWKRLLLEVPLSPRAEDALLRLAQMDQMRGRPASSREFLERMIRDYSDSGSQARAHYWLAKTFFDENQKPMACGALDVSRKAAPKSAVELVAQIEDLNSQCRGVTPVAVTTGVPANIPAVQTPPVAEPAAVVSTPTPAAPATVAVQETPAANVEARYSVQLAAFNRQSQAETLVRQLAAKRIEARVDGSSSPFRVRTGYFSTKTEAERKLRELKSQGHDGFVAELNP